MTEAEDFIEIPGFEKEVADPAFNSDGRALTGDGDESINFYYTRKKYSITYLDGAAFDGNGTRIADASNVTIHTSELINYEASIDDCGSYVPAVDYKEGYVFDGWYVDPTCTVPYTFKGNTMPDHNVTVYAKWQQIQYRVFLHPNVDSSDTSLDWGSDSQEMNFRISYGSKVSLPTGIRNEFELIGWYSDADCTKPYNEETVLNKTTVDNIGSDYDKTTHMTDPMDKYGNIGADAYNSDDADHDNRFWITREVNLYAKWRAKLYGAKGIQVIYDANGGKNPPVDDSLYLDQALAIAEAASTAPKGKKFDHWVVQKWDDTAYVDTEVTVTPGNNFTVLKENAKVEANDDNTEDNPSYTYTVQLKAVYVDDEEPATTEIHWHTNVRDVAGNAITVTHPDTAAANTELDGDYYLTDKVSGDLLVNEAVDIRAWNTYSSGAYKFLGWSKDRNATTPDFLIWDGSKYTTTDGTVVTQVAADLKDPAGNDLYAIWKGVFYVYHSGVADGNVETIDMPSGTVDLTQKVTSGYLYGGYYFDYAGKGSYAGDGVKVTDGVTYDGMNQTWTDPQTVSGTTLKPVAGETYFIKEVPTYYLRNYYQINFMKVSKELKGLYLISAVDDLNYSESGFDLQTTDKKTATVYADLTIYNYGTGKSITLKPSNVFNSLGITSGGYLAYWDATNDTNYFKANTTFTVLPFWVTMDGVKVSGASTRTVTITDLTKSGISKTDSPVNP